MPVFLLDDEDLSFPAVELSLPDGLLAIGGDLSVARLLIAYRHGIFPWYNEPHPIMWWSPGPRLVLFPERLHLAKSMRVLFNQKAYSVSYNKCFDEVIRSCGEITRKEQDGTWIQPEITKAYTALHKAGYAHSVEVWDGDELAGGLYGIALGKVFFGESMFAKKSNASKFGFISLVQRLQSLDFKLIDCQQDTPHLRSLGAELIDRSLFTEILDENFQKYNNAKLNLDHHTHI